MSPARRGHPAGRTAVARAVVEARQLDPAVVGRQVGDADLEVDRRGQDEAVVVVGVLADEVDPTGRPDDPDLAAPPARGRFDGDECLDQLFGLEGLVVTPGAVGRDTQLGATGRSSRRSQPGLNSRIRCWRWYGWASRASQSSSMPRPGASGTST